MKSLHINTRTTLLGLASWAIPFFLSFFFFSQTGELTIPRTLFKSLMVVIGGGSGAVLLIFAFRKVVPTLNSGISIGLYWLAINWLLDIAILLPMSGMDATEYFFDIGLRYLMLPIMTVMAGIIAEKA